MLGSGNWRCQREFWCWEVGCYTSTSAILKDTSRFSPQPEQPGLSPGVVPMELLKRSYMERYIQRCTKPGLGYCTERWCARVGSILIWAGRDLWRSCFKSQLNAGSASILYSAIVLDVLAQPNQSRQQRGISCHLLGIWTQQDELKSVLIATAKSKETCVCSIVTMVSCCGKVCSHKFLVNWDNAWSTEQRRWNKSRNPQISADFEMAELAGISWLSAVAELWLFHCQQKWPNAEVGRS